LITLKSYPNQKLTEDSPDYMQRIQST
jgi:hypothetical protein